MNERKIIDRKCFRDLAKEVGLTTLDLEALGENHHREIVVEGNFGQHQKIGVMQRN